MNLPMVRWETSNGNQMEKSDEKSLINKFNTNLSFSVFISKCRQFKFPYLGIFELIIYSENQKKGLLCKWHQTKKQGRCDESGDILLIIFASRTLLWYTYSLWRNILFWTIYIIAILLLTLSLNANMAGMEFTRTQD